jgi:hypothetical protein
MQGITRDIPEPDEVVPGYGDVRKSAPYLETKRIAVVRSTSAASIVYVT